MGDIALVLVVLLVVVLIWRGPKTLPLLGRAFGQGVKEARKELDEIKAGDGAMASTDAQPPPSTAAANPPAATPPPSSPPSPNPPG